MCIAGSTPITDQMIEWGRESEASQNCQISQATGLARQQQVRLSTSVMQSNEVVPLDIQRPIAQGRQSTRRRKGKRFREINTFYSLPLGHI